MRCLRGLLALLVFGLCAGCEITPEQAARDVCTAYCDCVASPAQSDQCVAQCVPDLPPVTDPCLQCVYMNSATCSDLFDECTSLCLDDPLSPPGGM